MRQPTIDEQIAHMDDILRVELRDGVDGFAQIYIAILATLRRVRDEQRRTPADTINETTF